MDRPSFLDALDPDARAALLGSGRARRYPKGSLLCAEGDDGHEVMILRSGAVKVVVSAASGREVILDVLHAGDVVGELSAVDGGARSASVYAAEACVVLVIDHDRFTGLLATHPGLAHGLLRVLAGRLRGAARRQLEFGASDALGRLCQRLVELERRYGAVGEDGNATVEVPFSQSDLARWAGLSREAVVKALRALRTLGWIELDGRRLVILDPAAVGARASA